jgi:hypothetical protein
MCLKKKPLTVQVNRQSFFSDSAIRFMHKFSAVPHQYMPCSNCLIFPIAPLLFFVEYGKHVGGNIIQQFSANVDPVSCWYHCVVLKLFQGFITFPSSRWSCSTSVWCQCLETGSTLVRKFSLNILNSGRFELSLNWTRNWNFI